MFKNHPRGLPVLFFTEMWERFGFYILIAVFVLYMDEQLGWDDSRKGDFYAWFLFAVYFFPLAGGWLGDRVFGHLNTVRVGSVLMIFGYTALAFSSRDQILSFHVGLALVAVGTGVFKTNVSVLVGNLYEEGSELKDSGFNIFYMGVNIGAAAAPLAATLFHGLFDSYRVSFAAAAVGMGVATFIFQSGKGRLIPANERSAARAPLHAGPVPARTRLSVDDGRRIVTLAALFFIVVFFWVAFYQNGFAMTLFAQRSTVVSELLRPETYQFFAPFFILLLTPLLLMFFSWLRRRGKEPTTAGKIFLGMLISSLSMLIMAIASKAGGDRDLNIMSPVWLIASYFVITVGEILVSPMGLSCVSHLAPLRVRGLMMGGWFVATAVGSYGSGLVGKYYSTFSHHDYFVILSALLLAASLSVLLILGRLNRSLRQSIEAA
jgi:POT family proton-dependent oligopeptide transporter